MRSADAPHAPASAREDGLAVLMLKTDRAGPVLRV